jgi:hypothetical protein
MDDRFRYQVTTFIVTPERLSDAFGEKRFLVSGDATLEPSLGIGLYTVLPKVR